MSKNTIKDSKPWSLLLLGNCLAFLGIQTLMLWLGNFFPFVDNFGVYINVALAFLLWIPIYVILKLEKKLRVTFVALFFLGYVGIYLYLTVYASLCLIALSITGVLLALALGEKEKINPYVLYGYSACHLLYTVCGWGAMTLLGIPPAVSIWHWGGLFLLTLGTWFIPLYKE